MKPRNPAQWIDQRITIYRGHLISFSELNQSDDLERQRAVEDFVHALAGKIENERQGRYADLIDTIPILGDFAQLFVIGRTEMEYQKYQITDFLLGLVPLIGDIADYLFTPDTNKKIAEARLRQEYYNSLIAVNKSKEAEVYRQEVKELGYELRAPKQKELDLLLGTADGKFVKLSEWEKAKLKQTADTWSKFGVFGWRKLAGKGERKGVNDRVQIKPKSVERGLDKAQTVAKVGQLTSKDAIKQKAKEKLTSGKNKKSEDTKKGGVKIFTNFVGKKELEN